MDQNWGSHMLPLTWCTGLPSHLLMGLFKNSTCGTISLNLTQLFFCKAGWGEVFLFVGRSLSLRVTILCLFPEPSNPFPLTAHVTWNYGHIHHWMLLSQKDTRSCWREILSLHTVCWNSSFSCKAWCPKNTWPNVLHDGIFHFLFITVRNGGEICFGFKQLRYCHQRGSEVLWHADYSEKRMIKYNPIFRKTRSLCKI